MKVFRITGKCIPSKHYMVDISRQVEAACKYVYQNIYFCINRGRQFGKTTTISRITDRLSREGYTVFSVSFENFGKSEFATTERLCLEVVNILKNELDIVNNITDDLKNTIINTSSSTKLSVDKFSQFLRQICALNNKIVLIIDEVDKAGNYDSFVEFLAILRKLYLNNDNFPSFQSVILAGVHDIRHLKMKMRPDSEHTLNSPWNIALPFKADMSLPENGIADMIAEFKADHNLDFNEKVVAKEIHNWTSGYPYFVSRICYLIEEQEYSWDKDGVLKAVKYILNDRDDNLCCSFIKKTDDYPALREMLYNMLYRGVEYSYNPDDKITNIGFMFSFLKKVENKVWIQNRILETRLYNMFFEEEQKSKFYVNGSYDKNGFITPDGLDMPKILQKFSEHYNKIFNETDEEFIESQGRKLFLLYLRPIINGIGHYYIEAETRDRTRTDIVIDYKSKQYIIELKIWRGEQYNSKGEIQLSEYLNHFGLTEGYMVSYNFNKKKSPGVEKVEFGDKVIWEVEV